MVSTRSPTAGRLLIGIALVAALAACGSPDRAPRRTELGTPHIGTPPGYAPSRYPDGPYGGSVGDVIANYGFEGYVVESANGLANQVPYTDYSLDAMRRSDRDYAVLFLAETWCGTCQITAQELALLGSDLEASGALAVEVLLSGDRDTLEAWVRGNGLEITSVVAQDETMKVDLGGREWAIMVNLETMKIVWRQYGVTVSLAEAALEELARLR